MEFAYGSRSMLGGNKIYTMLLHFWEQKGLNHMKIEDTVIPFRAVAVDLYSGLLNNLPTDVARDAGMGHVLAVDVAREKIVKEPKSMIHVLQRSFDVLLSDNANRRLPLADLILRPDVGQYMAFELSKITACIKVGEKEAEANIKLIMELAQA